MTMPNASIGQIGRRGRRAHALVTWPGGARRTLCGLVAKRVRRAGPAVTCAKCARAAGLPLV